MRVLATVLAVAAALALAGCSSQPDSPVDPESVDSKDYELPLLLLGIAVIAGVVLLAINLSRGNSDGSTPPSAPAHPAWQPADDDGSDEAAAERTPRKSSRTAPAPPRRRRAP